MERWLGFGALSVIVAERVIMYWLVGRGFFAVATREFRRICR